MIEVIVAPKERKAVLWEMYQEYAHELSEYDHEKRRGGAYHYPCFDFFWEQDRCVPFIILYDHEPIGFCFMQDIGLSYRIDEFYIRPLHRRRKFGHIAVRTVVEHCRKLGRHKTITANVYVNNEPALAFWKSVGFRDTGRRERVKDLRLVETEANLDDAVAS
ncbi:MAG: GNAT family N-acetyltransferase [Armatimonadota bacterium]